MRDHLEILGTAFSSGEASRRGHAVKALAVTLVLLFLASCAASGWQWRRPDGSYDEDQLQEDIDACEEYAVIADMGIRARGGPSRARPRGGWGNFSFEHCMHERDWRLKRVKPRESAR